MLRSLVGSEMCIRDRHHIGTTSAILDRHVVTRGPVIRQNLHTVTEHCPIPNIHTVDPRLIPQNRPIRIRWIRPKIHRLSRSTRRARRDHRSGSWCRRRRGRGRRTRCWSGRRSRRGWHPMLSTSRAEVRFSRAGIKRHDVIGRSRSCVRGHRVGPRCRHGRNILVVGVDVPSPHLDAVAGLIPRQDCSLIVRGEVCRG